MPRLYGFENQARTHLRDSEAGAGREAASRVLAGQFRSTVVEWLNAEGHRGTMGMAWSVQALSRWLANPAIAGLVKDPETGELVESGLPFVITPDEFGQLQGDSAKNAEKFSGEGGRSGHDYWASGELLECGNCTHHMVGSATPSGTPGYRCRACNKVQVMADPLETHIAEHVLAELLRPEHQQAMETARQRIAGQVEDLRQEVKRLEASRGDLAASYRTADLSLTAYKKADKDISAQLKTLRPRLRYLEQVEGVPLGGAEEMVQWWKYAPSKSKLALVALHLEKVVVHPAPSRGVRGVEDRVELVWHT